MKNLFCFLILFFLSLPSTLYSQEDEPKREKVLVYLFDGRERIGYIISDDGREILLDSDDLGKIYINKNDIQRIKRLEDIDHKIVDGEFRAVGPITTRYTFTTNAFGLRKGEHYGIVNLYGPEMHFTLGKNFTAGILTSWVLSPLVASLKYSTKTGHEKVNFGLGTLFGTPGYLNNFVGYGGLHYAMVTFGDRMNNLTISGGFSYIDGFQREKNYTKPGIYYPHNSWTTNVFTVSEKLQPNMITAPVIGLGALARISAKSSFVFDSMVFFGNQKDELRVSTNHYDSNGSFLYTEVVKADKKTTLMFLMPGLRFQGKPNEAFQLSLAGLTIFGEKPTRSIPFPLFTYFFQF